MKRLHVREAALDGRVREEVRGDAGRGGAFVSRLRKLLTNSFLFFT